MRRRFPAVFTRVSMGLACAGSAVGCTTDPTEPQVTSASEASLTDPSSTSPSPESSTTDAPGTTTATPPESSDDDTPGTTTDPSVGSSESTTAVDPTDEPPTSRPSPGCGTASPQTGSAQSPLNVASHQYYAKLPASYDPNRPYPVIIMFHPTNNPLNWAENNAGFENTAAADEAIRVYPGAGNNASGWGAGDVSFFDPFFEQITNDYCIDLARVFAAGESSGGDFASILGCEFADKVRVVAPGATKPVSGYPLDAGQRTCTGQASAVVIHGLNDNVVGPQNGPATRDFYVALNHCGSTTVPVEGFTDPLSNCVRYDGCDEGYPVVWCGHTDPEYNNTNHGWPRFAARMLWQYFSEF